MSELLVHFAVPFAALVLLGSGFRRASFASLFALLPDLDALLRVHRSFTHSLIIVLVFALPLFVLAQGLSRDFMLLALLGVSFHLTLDLFTGYTPLLWPLYGDSLLIWAELGAHIASPSSLSLDVGLLTTPTTFSYLESLDAPLFTGEGLITSLILLVPPVLRGLRPGKWAEDE
ncbi:MAG: metal-dependent hydrolase [Candidatus Geothermarchaeales archaeon]